MIEKPKYSKNEKVAFLFDNGKEKNKVVGRIAIIDRFGTFEQKIEISYDIFAEDGCLHKHVIESYVLEILCEE